MMCATLPPPPTLLQDARVSAAISSRNIYRNRYRDILPYDVCKHHAGGHFGQWGRGEESWGCVATTREWRSRMCCGHVLCCASGVAWCGVVCFVVVWCSESVRLK